MNPDEFCRQVANGKVPPVVAVIGSEPYLQTKVLQAIRAAVLRDGVPGLNDDSYIAGDASTDTIISAARTLPMLAQRRLVTVRQVERWEAGAKGERDALDRLADYAAAPIASCVLVLIGSKLDGRKRLATMAKKGDWWIACDPILRAGVGRFIVQCAEERRVRVDASTADLIAEVVGTELSGLVDAVERLCLYVADKGSIDEDDVGMCLARVRTSSVWELVGAIGQRDLGRALAALDAVYDPRDRGLPIVGTMAWSARQLLRFESSLRRGMSPAQAAQAAGAPPFRANELADQCRKTSRHDLERWLEAIAGVDLALKGASKRPPKAVLEHAVLAMCRGARSSSASSRSPA